MDEHYENIKLGDFGLSRYVDQHDDVPGQHPLPIFTARHLEEVISEEKTAGVGTYIYASPEQIEGKNYNAKTDMYSLGMVLLEMCHPTFTTQMERYRTMIEARENKIPTKFQVPDEVMTMIRKLLSPLPTHRPSAAEVVEWVGSMLGQRIVLPRRTSIAADEITLQIESKGNPSGKGVLLEVTEGIHNACPSVNISQCRVFSRNQVYVLEFVFARETRKELDSVIAAIENLPGVVNVRQV